MFLAPAGDLLASAGSPRHGGRFRMTTGNRQLDRPMHR